MNKLKKFIYYISKTLWYLMGDIIYGISYLVPKVKNKWLFGAWFGKGYSDNSKYFFEYVVKNHLEIKAIWITKNSAVVSSLQAKGFPVYHVNNPIAWWHMLSAKVFCICCGKMDISWFYITAKSLLINLWHGTPLKKIMYDDKYSKIDAFDTRMKEIVFPFLKNNFDYLIAPSEEVQKIFSSAFKMPKDHVLVTGYPRNDLFFTDIYSRVADEKIILYAPTHRNAGISGEIKNILPKDEDWAKINALLVQNNSILYLRLHFCDQRFLPNDLDKFPNIKVDRNPDVQISLYNADVLITDYSSLYFDYLLLDRPIIFAPFDLKEYLCSDREMYYDYNDITPGIKVYSWEKLINILPSVIEGKDDDKQQRAKIIQRFCQYKDGKSGNRLFEVILNKINK